MSRAARELGPRALVACGAAMDVARADEATPQRCSKPEGPLDTAGEKSRQAAARPPSSPPSPASVIKSFVNGVATARSARG